MGLFASIQSFFSRSTPPRAMQGMVRVGGDAPPQLGTKELLALYHSTPEVQTPLRLISQRFGSIPFEVRRGEDVVEDHPIQKILTRPNPYMSGVSARALEQRCLDLPGEFFAVLLPNEETRELEYYPLPPHMVTEREDASYVVSIGGSHVPFPRDEVLHVKHYDLLDPYGRGKGAGWSIVDEAQTAEHAAKHTSAYFYNRATPEALITLEGATQADLDRFKADWRARYQGFRKAYEAAVTSRKIDVQILQTTFKESQIIEVRQHSADIIRQVYGVPPELIGQLEHSNRATIQAALDILGDLVLEPRASFWAAEMNAKLVPLFEDDQVEIWYPSQKSVNTERLDALMSAHPYAFTLNEIREQAGLKPREDGERYAVPSMVELVEAAEVRGERAPTPDYTHIRVHLPAPPAPVVRLIDTKEVAS